MNADVINTTIDAAGMFGRIHTAGPLLIWVIVVSFVFVECAVIIGLFLPGDSLLITAGIVMASHAHSHGHGAGHVWALAIGAMVAAILGNQVGYVIGHRTGSKLVARKNGKYLNTANLHKVNGMLEKYGFWAVLLSRWIPWVRTLCPPVAGAAKMNHRTYTVASTLGAVIWAPVLLLVGFYFGSVLDLVPWLLPSVLGVMTALLVAGTGFGVWQYRKEMNRPLEVVEVDEL